MRDMSMRVSLALARHTTVSTCLFDSLDPESTHLSSSTTKVHNGGTPPAGKGFDFAFASSPTRDISGRVGGTAGGAESTRPDTSEDLLPTDSDRKGSPPAGTVTKTSSLGVSVSGEESTGGKDVDMAPSLPTDISAVVISDRCDLLLEDLLRLDKRGIAESVVTIPGLSTPCALSTTPPVGVSPGLELSSIIPNPGVAAPPMVGVLDIVGLRPTPPPPPPPGKGGTLVSLERAFGGGSEYGSSNQNMLPLPYSDSTPSRPLLSLTICRTSARPNPEPLPP